MRSGTLRRECHIHSFSPSQEWSAAVSDSMGRSTMVVFAVHTVAMDQHWIDVGDRAVIEQLLDLQAGAADSHGLPLCDEGHDDDMGAFDIHIDPQSASEGEGDEFDELIPPLASVPDSDLGDETKVLALYSRCAHAFTSHSVPTNYTSQSNHVSAFTPPLLAVADG